MKAKQGDGTQFVATKDKVRRCEVIQVKFCKEMYELCIKSRPGIKLLEKGN